MEEQKINFIKNNELKLISYWDENHREVTLDDETDSAFELWLEESTLEYLQDAVKSMENPTVNDLMKNINKGAEELQELLDDNPTKI